MTTTATWRTDWDHGPTAHTIAEMIHGRPVGDAEVQQVYDWLASNDRLREANELVTRAKRALQRGRPWTATRIVEGVEQPEEVVGWSNAHEAARFKKAGAALLDLVKDVEAAVTGNSG